MKGIMNKRMVREVVTGLVISCFTILLFFLILEIVSEGIIDDTVRDLVYERIASSFENDTIVEYIYDLCNNNTDWDKIHCVNKQFTKFFIYKLREDKKIRSPIKTFLDGGVCRDSAVLYCAVFKKMNINCKFLNVNVHIFNLVYTDELYCLIDQFDIGCTNVTDNR